MIEKIKKLKAKALKELENIEDLEALEEFRVNYLGRKGNLKQYLSRISELPEEKRPEAGRVGNQVKNILKEHIKNKKDELQEEEIQKEKIDGTLPGRRGWIGSQHPLRSLIRESVRVFSSMGFEVATGPDIESEYYNFDALNTPEEHPARDIQDTFYLENGKLLRTQTSPVQIRVMEKEDPPVRIIAPGRCFRRDTIDSTHHINFFQLEGLYIDRNVDMKNLKGALTVYAKKLLGKNAQIRFRPHYFPFTEPSVEYDFMCSKCAGEGCNFCDQKGWLEIAGAGMVDPNVLKEVGYDPEEWQGYAFGLGFDRIAMTKYSIDDIRLLYENDLRFLRQFQSFVV